MQRATKRSVTCGSAVPDLYKKPEEYNGLSRALIIAPPDSTTSKNAIDFYLQRAELERLYDKLIGALDAGRGLMTP